MLLNAKKDILNGNTVTQIILFSIPLIGSYLLKQVYSFVDSIILGQYAGKIALAAIGYSNMLLNVLLNFISGIVSAITIIVAQSYGSRNEEKLKNIVKTSFFISIVLGVILTILVFIFDRSILTLTNCPTEAMKDSLIYLRIYSTSFVAYLIFEVGKFILCAVGETRISIISTIVIAIIKIILDLVLTGSLKMGIWGVGISTVMSYVVCALIILKLFKDSDGLYQFEIKEIGFVKEEFKEIVIIGIPAALQSMFYAFTSLLIQTKINIYGTDTMAAFSAYCSVDNIYWSIQGGISNAMVTLVGQNYGSKNIKRVRKIIFDGIIINTVVSILMTTLITLSGRYILLLFSNDEAVLEIARNMIWYVSLAYPLYSILEVVISSCKACGDVVQTMLISLFCVCIFRIVYISFMQFNNVIEVLYCYGISWFLTSTVSLIYFLTNKKYKLTKNN